MWQEASTALSTMLLFAGLGWSNIGSVEPLNSATSVLIAFTKNPLFKLDHAPLLDAVKMVLMFCKSSLNVLRSHAMSPPFPVRS